MNIAKLFGGLALLVIGLIFLIGSAKVKGRSKVANMPKFFAVLLFSVVLIFGLVLVYQANGLAFMKLSPAGFSVAGVIGGNNSGVPICSYGGTYPNCNPAPTGQCPYAPSATYSGVEYYTSATLTGTSEYQLEGNRMTTTAISNTPENSMITYWINNGTEYVTPLTKRVICQVGQPFQVTGIANATTTAMPTVWDTKAHATVTPSGTNTTIGTGGSNGFEISYTGISQKALMPYGGLLVVEYNSTAFASEKVEVSGNDITANSGKFHITPAVVNTANTYKVYEILPSLDDQTGHTKTIYATLSASGTVDPTSLVYFKFYPANYYLGTDGNMHLDVEKFADGSSTRVGLGSISLEFDIV